MPPGGAVPSEKWGDWPITSMEEVLCLSHLIEQSMPDVLLQLYKMKLRHPKVNMNCDDHADPNCKLYSAVKLFTGFETQPQQKNSNLAVKGVALPVSSFTNTIQHLQLAGQYTLFITHIKIKWNHSS